MDPEVVDAVVRAMVSDVFGMGFKVGDDERVKCSKRCVGGPPLVLD